MMKVTMTTFMRHPWWTEPLISSSMVFFENGKKNRRMRQEMMSRMMTSGNMKAIQ